MPRTSSSAAAESGVRDVPTRHPHPPLRNRKTGGMGLGLTVARTIIRAHGGDITLENKRGGGLRVTVTLPQARDGE